MRTPRLLRPGARFVGLGVAAALAPACLGSTGGGSVPTGARLVSVFHMAFRPRVVTIHVDQTVTWRFGDAQVNHNVDSRSGGFRSPDLDAGTWSHTFRAPGTFSYFCTIHPYMVGAVVVLPAKDPGSSG